MYVMLNTRPDLSAAVNFFSQFQSNAAEAQWIGLKRILRYIHDTVNLDLFYRRKINTILIGYANSDWAGDVDRKSTTGFLFEVLGAPVIWVTKKQSTVALSSTEAEYVALANATKELIWFRRLLKELGFESREPVVILRTTNPAFIYSADWNTKD